MAVPPAPAVLGLLLAAGGAIPPVWGLAFWLAVAAGSWVFFRVAKHRAVNRTAEAACPLCAASAEGLHRPICPNCKCDLGRAGVIRPGGRRSMDSVTRLAQWTALVPLAAVVAAEAAADAGPAAGWVIYAACVPLWGAGVLAILWLRRREWAGLRRPPVIRARTETRPQLIHIRPL